MRRATDLHPPLAVLLQVRAQDLVRVVMIARDEPLKICLVDRTLESDRCTHDRSLPDQAP